MRSLLQLLNSIRAFFRRGIADEELDAELHAFLETAVDEKIRRGMSRERPLAPPDSRICSCRSTTRRGWTQWAFTSP